MSETRRNRPGLVESMQARFFLRRGTGSLVNGTTPPEETAGKPLNGQLPTDTSRDAVMARGPEGMSTPPTAQVIFEQPPLVQTTTSGVLDSSYGVSNTTYPNEVTSNAPVPDGDNQTNNSRKDAASFYRRILLEKHINGKLRWLTTRASSRPREEIEYFKSLNAEEREELVGQAEDLYRALQSADRTQVRAVEERLGMSASFLRNIVEGLSSHLREYDDKIEQGQLSEKEKAMVLRESAASLLNPRNIVHPFRLVDNLVNSYQLSGYTLEEAKSLAVRTAVSVATSVAYHTTTSAVTVGGVDLIEQWVSLPIDDSSLTAKGAAFLIHGGVVLISNRIPRSDHRLLKATDGMSIEPEKVLAHALSRKLFPDDDGSQENAARVAHWGGANPVFPVPRAVEETLLIGQDVLFPERSIVGHTLAGMVMGGRILAQNAAAKFFEQRRQQTATREEPVSLPS